LVSTERALGKILIIRRRGSGTPLRTGEKKESLNNTTYYEGGKKRKRERGCPMGGKKVLRMSFSELSDYGEKKDISHHSERGGKKDPL